MSEFSKILLNSHALCNKDPFAQLYGPRLPRAISLSCVVSKSALMKVLYNLPV